MVIVLEDDIIAVVVLATNERRSHITCSISLNPLTEIKIPFLSN